MNKIKLKNASVRDEGFKCLKTLFYENILRGPKKNGSF
jgi:hypothetical protein